MISSYAYKLWCPWPAIKTQSCKACGLQCNYIYDCVRVCRDHTSIFSWVAARRWNSSEGAISPCQLAIAALLCRSRNTVFIGASDNESTNFPTWWTLYTQGLRIMLRIGRLNRDPYFNNYSIVFCHVYIYVSTTLSMRIQIHSIGSFPSWADYQHPQILRKLVQFKLPFLIKYFRKTITNHPDLATMHCGL